MKIVLPKPSRGYVFPRLFGVEMNDFDVERLLPSLFYLTVTRGRGRARRVNDPTQLSAYVSAVCDSARVKGFGDELSGRAMDKWLRSAIVRVGRMGLSRSRHREQIDHVLPLTIASYKAGFPAESTRQRKVHIFVYSLLVDAVRQAEGVASPAKRIYDIFEEAFGHGVSVGGGPNYNAAYDGRTQVDIHALLSLAFLEGLAPTPARKKEPALEADPTVPAMARRIGDDLLKYLLAYRQRIPAMALARGFEALVNACLLAYTLALVRGTLDLVSTRELPSAWSGDEADAGVHMYVDFTQERLSPSDGLARACVERDLESLAAFFPASLMLRTLDRFLELQPELHTSLEAASTPEYLLGLVKTQDEPSVRSRAQMEIEAIRKESELACDNDEDAKAVQSYFSAQVGRAGFEPLGFAVDLLAAPQRKRGVEAFIKWYWSVGGLRKPFGILSGNLTGRRNWRYAMSDDLLLALVHLALVEDTSGRLESVTIRPRLRLQEFLAFLESRFGILVDRPPNFLDSASARQAGAKNLESLKRRLRQMGFFSALSDDFTAQYIESPAFGEVSP